MIIYFFSVLISFGNPPNIYRIRTYTYSMRKAKSHSWYLYLISAYCERLPGNYYIKIKRNISPCAYYTRLGKFISTFGHDGDQYAMLKFDFIWSHKYKVGLTSSNQPLSSSRSDTVLIFLEKTLHTVLQKNASILQKWRFLFKIIKTSKKPSFKNMKIIAISVLVRKSFSNFDPAKLSLNKFIPSEQFRSESILSK